MEWEVRLLGPLRVTRDGEQLSLGGLKQGAVLVRLAVARGELISADALVQALWTAEDRPADPRATLQSYISRLRRGLQPGESARARDRVLVSAGNAYALDLPVDAVDAWRFERLVDQGSAVLETDPGTALDLLRQALALWQGPALADYADDAWATPVVARLDELREVARERLFAARIACGESAVVVPDLEALVEAAPLREERWSLLALALYRAHRQADALAAMRRAREVLSEELGVDPGPALQNLERQLFAQAPELLAAQAPPSPTTASVSPPSQVRRRPAHAATGASAEEPLVERVRELSTLEASLDGASEGVGSVTMVEGPAGIGKSRLLVEVRRRAAELGLQVFHARASQLETEYSYGVVRQLFEPLFAEGEPEGRDLLRGQAAAARSVFDSGVPGPGGQDSAFAVLHGLYWLTAHLAAERPTLLVVDDIHWCDAGSLRFVAYLARRLQDIGVALVLGYRSGEQHALGPLIDELRTDLSTVPVRPTPLTSEGLSSMIADRLREEPAEEFVAACFDGTSGNPLLVRQLLRGLENDQVRPDRAHADLARALSSRAVSSTVILRLRRLSPDASKVARALAVLGDGADLPLVAELAGLPETTAAEATAQLARAEIVRPEPPLTFVHPLVRDAVYSEASPGERELAHETAARILEAGRRSDEQIAAQLLLAPHRGNAWVVETLRRAARDAAGRANPDAAVTLLRRALAEPPTAEVRPHVLLDLGLYEALTDGPAAGRDLRAAYEILPDEADRASAALALTRTLVFVGEFGSPVRFAADALQRMPEHLVEPRAAVLAYERIAAQMHSVDPLAWGPDEEPPIPGAGPGSRMLQAAVAFERMTRAVPRAEAVALAKESMADGQLVAADPGLLWVWSQVVLDLADEDVLPGWDAINATVQQRGSLFGVLAVRFWRAWSLMRRGRLHEAEESIRTGLEQLEMWQPDATTRPYGHATLAKVLYDQDRLDEAAAVIGDAARPPTAMDGDRLLWEVRAQMLLGADRPQEALRLLDAVVGRVPHVTNPAWRGDRLLHSLAAARCGALSHPVADVEEMLAHAQRWGAPGAIAETLLVLGLLRGRDGVEELREAVGLVGPDLRPVLYGDALLALGNTLVSGPEAVSSLHEAHRIGRLTGAARLVRMAEQSLDHHGLAAVPLAPSD